ncbi:MAG: hypothetical protein A2284_14205 [Deltaproteobacteria bacterium RIFOXYA12_FULL_61_11]|nr:MAG: hypothetical protein A2284_14205 [Deltaproteobacteria bacterium RIFOXYA12_FULL_61_11]
MKKFQPQSLAQLCWITFLVVGCENEPTTSPPTKEPLIDSTTSRPPLILDQDLPEDHALDPVAELAPGAIVSTDQGKDGFLVTCGVINTGSTISKATEVVWSAGEVELGRQLLPSVEPGQTYNSHDFELLVPSPTDGDTLLVFTVDPENLVEEVDELNNSTSLRLSPPTQPASSTQPDQGVVPVPDQQPFPIDLMALPLEILSKENTRWTFDSGVKNHGTTASPSFTVRWIITPEASPTNERTEERQHAPVGSGTTILGDPATEFEHVFLTAGDYLVSLHLDPVHALGETFLENNTVSLTVTIPDVLDLAIVKFVPTTLEYLSSARVLKLSVVVANQGTRTVEKASIHWSRHYSGSDALPIDLSTTDFGPLLPGAEASVTRSTTLELGVGSHELLAEILLGTVVEFGSGALAANNTRTYRVDIKAGGPIPVLW